MNRNKHIDDLFKEGLTNFTETPPPHVWDAIQEELQGSKRNKKIIVFWRSTAAAVLLGLVILGGLFYRESTNSDPMVSTRLTSIEKTQNKNNISLPNDDEITNHSHSKLNHKPATEPKANHSNHQITMSSKHHEVTAQNSKITGHQQTLTTDTEQATKHKKSLYSNNNNFKTTDSTYAPFHKIPTTTQVAFTNTSSVNASQVFKTLSQKTVINLKNKATNDLLMTINQQAIRSEADKKRDLQIVLGGQFSPSYSYRETETSESNKAVNEDGIMSYTGGINLHIKTKKRWGIETGIYYSQVGQKFSNPLLSTSESMAYRTSFDAGLSSQEPNLQNSMGRIKLKSTAQEDLISDVAESTANIQLNTISKTLNTANETEILKVQQELDYIEIPFLLRYDLLKKRVDVSVSGGVSTYFLIGNGAYQLENNSKDKIGEMEDINNINYSAVFGLGLKTPLFKSLDFNFEPRVKYFINSVTEKGDSYKPYSLGIYTGISYTF